ncbi:MAG: UrcA family protein [Terriglobales bacterium]
MNRITSSTRLHSLLATAIFSTLASSFAVLSMAADSDQVPQLTVKYGDLNVSRSQGASVLYGRIRAAALGVCSNWDQSDPFSNMGRRDCVKQAIANAVSKVNQPALFAVYNAKNEQPLPMLVATKQPR